MSAVKYQTIAECLEAWAKLGTPEQFYDFHRRVFAQRGTTDDGADGHDRRLCRTQRVRHAGYGEDGADAAAEHEGGVIFFGVVNRDVLVDEAPKEDGEEGDFPEFCHDKKRHGEELRKERGDWPVQRRTARLKADSSE